MIDFTNKLGQRTAQRLKEEQVIWLTTIDSHGVPQPRPVWFVWDGATFIIYSRPDAKKLAHIAKNPSVSLHFNGDAHGGDIQVFNATAALDAQAAPANQVATYLEKYRAGIASIRMTPESFSATYSAAIRATPTKLRGI